MTYSDLYLLNILRNFSHKNNRTPSEGDFMKVKNTKYPSYMTYIKRFGSWNNSLKTAGLCINEFHHNNLSDEELLNYLVKFKEKNGKTPINDDFGNDPEYPCQKTYTERFGSWNKALELAGLSVNYQNHTEDELLSSLNKFYKENNKVPTQRDFVNNPKYPAYSNYIYKFGTWNEALKKANLFVNQIKHTDISDNELLEFLTQFHNKNGLIPSSCDFKNNPEYPSYGTYVNRFGSWTNALKIVNLDVDTVVSQGILVNNYQKGRQAELIVINHFKESPTDLSGSNCLSHCDGICPNGLIYDVKSSKCHNIGNGQFSFNIENKYKESIELYYCLGFDETHSKLIYAWRIPNNVVNNYFLKISISPSEGELTTDNMQKFEITYTMKEILNKTDLNKPQKSLLDYWVK